MKILYVDHYAGSISMGMEFRPYYLAKEWQKLGHDVRVVGADYSHLRIKQPDIRKEYSVETIDGVNYQWIKTIRYEGNGARRAISIIQFVLKLWLSAKRIAKEYSPDVVISSSTYPLDAYACARIAKKAKAKYIHEAHDVWPATLIEMGGMSPKHPFIQLLARAEKYAYKKPDKVVSLLPATKEHMLQCGMKDPEKFLYIPNGIVSDDWKEPEKLDTETLEIFNKLHSENKFIVGYLGGHALTNALHTLIDAAIKLKNNKDIAFVLVGKGVEKQKLIDRVKSENIDNTLFLPPVRKKQVPSALENMDALYIGAADCPLYRFGISMNKLYDYMMAGKPIIYGIRAANNEVKEAECGITIEPESTESLVNAILEIKGKSSEERERLGLKGKKWVLENREYETLAKQFVEVMK